MALAININDLLNKQKIESNRIEFKNGWNQASIYHSICAFANDFGDLGGGYIVVGVDTDEETGIAIRPVEGIPIEKIDGILKDMVGYNNKISPYYMPRTSVEEVDGKQVLVIWCPAGINRPYSVPENVTAKSYTKEYFYIRSGTSSIIAKGEVLDELRELITQIIDRTLEYLNRMLVMQTVIKPKDNSRSHKFFTYPYQALEESVTNSLYHRDYREWEPVVITVEPQGITIQNVGGPDRSISAADISRCEILVSKRYRNRRLGEYLKELDLTEGRSTGIPTIQNVLENNGSPRATVATDEDRTFFRITIPCHESAGNVIADIAHKDGSLRASKRGTQKTTRQSAPETALQSAPETALQIIHIIKANPNATLSKIAEEISVSRRWIATNMKHLQDTGVVKRVGPNKGGHWEVIGISE